MSVAEPGIQHSAAVGIAKCAVCKRGLGRNEIKVVLPSSAFLTNNNMPIEKRLSCANCYKALLIRTRIRRVSRAAGSKNRAIKYMQLEQSRVGQLSAAPNMYTY